MSIILIQQAIKKSISQLDSEKKRLVYQESVLEKQKLPPQELDRRKKHLKRQLVEVDEKIKRLKRGDIRGVRF